MENPEEGARKEEAITVEELPTEDDLPCDDGEPMETERHRDQMILLIEPLKIYWGDRKRFYVSGNMFIYYDPYDPRKFLGPDFFLVLDVERKERKSWVVWREGMRFPDLIVEILSDKTKPLDKGEKKSIYERLFRVGEYYLYDPFSQEFEGYRSVDIHFEPVMPDEEGKIYSSVADLYLIVKDNRLRWMNPEGIILPTGRELADQETQRADEERQPTEQERQRAEDLEKRLEEYRRRFGDLTIEEKEEGAR